MAGGGRERACRCHYPQSHLSFIPDAAGGSRGRCYPLWPSPVLPGTGTAPFRVRDILITMNTDCQAKVRQEDRQGDEPPLGKCRGQLSSSVFTASLLPLSHKFCQ